MSRPDCDGSGGCIEKFGVCRHSPQAGGGCRARKTKLNDFATLIKSAPELVPASAGKAKPAHAGKHWSEMTNLEKHNLAVRDRTTFDRLRKEAGIG